MCVAPQRCVRCRRPVPSNPWGTVSVLCHDTATARVTKADGAGVVSAQAVAASSSSLQRRGQGRRSGVWEERDAVVVAVVLVCKQAANELLPGAASSQTRFREARESVLRLDPRNDCQVAPRFTLLVFPRRCCTCSSFLWTLLTYDTLLLPP